MPRRPRIRIDPTRAASRTIAVSAAGDLNKLETDFLADKSVKDTKLANLEADKAVKDTKIANLESDKNDKDTRVAALESDKNDKDTKMSTMESDMALLASQVSLGNVRVSLGNLATRVTSLETLGIKGISNAVSWTNLTEINLSGEKLTNGDFSSVTNNAPTNWSVHSGTLDQTKLSSGIVDGTGGAVAIQQMFSSGIASGTTLVCKATRNDSGTGSVYIQALRVSGAPWSGNLHIQPSDGYVEFTTTEIMYGLRLTTSHGTREVSDISLFQGKVSGGTVQAYAGGGLEKISGASGYNSGGFSVNYIPGNADGYFQFQLAQNNKALRVGLVYADADYSTVSPFGLDFNATGNIDNMNPYQDNITTYAQGDWFRVRHYASSNQVHFQKRQTVYSQNTDFVFETASGSNYQYPAASRPLVISLDGTGTLTIGELYEVYTIRASDQALYVRDLDGNAHGYHGQGTRGVRFEVVEEAGQDYVTFLTSSTTTNGNDLYLDVAFDSVGGRINDVTIVT